MSNNLEVDPQDLRAFFQENEDDTVGKKADSDYCPLARYFWLRRGISVMVGNERIFSQAAPGTSRRLTLLERRFVTAIDEGSYENPEYIYGSEAVAVLDKVLARKD